LIRVLSAADVNKVRHSCCVNCVCSRRQWCCSTERCQVDCRRHAVRWHWVVISRMSLISWHSGSVFGMNEQHQRSPSGMFSLCMGPLLSVTDWLSDS